MRRIVPSVFVIGFIAGSLPYTLAAQGAAGSPPAHAPAPPRGPVSLAPAGARPVALAGARPQVPGAVPAVRLGPGAWIGGAGGCRAVVPRWTALGAVLGLVTPLALRAVGAGNDSGKDVAASAVIGAGAGAVTGAVMCRQAGRA